MTGSIFAKLTHIEIKLDEPLAKYTFTKTGGKADWLAWPKSVTEVKELLAVVRENHLPLTVIGNASNLIVRDGGIRGLVMMMTEMKSIEVNKHQVQAAAGARIIDVTIEALKAKLSGVEFAAGIPGSVGGAVYMNAGAYGGDVSEVITDIQVVTNDGQLITISGPAIDFSYRHSCIQDIGGTIVGATFSLHPGNSRRIKAQMDELNRLRASKQPLEYPSCGSVFKRPPGHYTGQLIQEAGLQGLTLGGAQISTKHAGFIVNINHATATDYLALIAHIQAVILKKFDVQLEPEVRIIGEAPLNEG